jgi:hypothetical protein
LCAINTYLEGSENFRSIDDPKQQKQWKEGNKRQGKKEQIGVTTEKGDSSLFSLSFFDAVATLLSLPLIIQEYERKTPHFSKVERKPTRT